MPIFLKNLILVFGGVAVVGGGIAAYQQFRKDGSNMNGATATVLDSVAGNTSNIASESTSSLNDVPKDALPINADVAETFEQPQTVEQKVSDLSLSETTGSIVAEAPFAPVSAVMPGFMTISGYIGPAGGGGGSSVNSGTSAPAVQQSVTASSSTTVVIEVSATTTTSAAETATVIEPAPLALCVLEPIATSSLIKAADYLLISKILVDNEGSDTNEFVEIFNPTDVPIYLTGWSLQYLSGSLSSFVGVTKKNFIANKSVAAKGKFLVGTGDFAGSSDMRWSQSLNNTGATIFLVHGQTLIGGTSDVRIVDRVAYGTGFGLKPEGEPATLPPVGQILARKNLDNGACVLPEGQAGEAASDCDMGDNLFDFVALPFVAALPVSAQ
jgi:hypothetical protein